MTISKRDAGRQGTTRPPLHKSRDRRFCPHRRRRGGPGGRPAPRQTRPRRTRMRWPAQNLIRLAVFSGPHAWAAGDRRSWDRRPAPGRISSQHSRCSNALRPAYCAAEIRRDGDGADRPTRSSLRPPSCCPRPHRAARLPPCPRRITPHGKIPGPPGECRLHLRWRERLAAGNTQDAVAAGGGIHRASFVRSASARVRITLPALRLRMPAQRSQGIGNRLKLLSQHCPLTLTKTTRRLLIVSPVRYKPRGNPGCTYTHS